MVRCIGNTQLWQPFGTLYPSARLLVTRGRLVIDCTSPLVLRCAQCGTAAHADRVQADGVLQPGSRPLPVTRGDAPACVHSPVSLAFGLETALQLKHARGSASSYAGEVQRVFCQAGHLCSWGLGGTAAHVVSTSPTGPPAFCRIARHRVQSFDALGA
jgi:hypothetical protein